MTMPIDGQLAHQFSVACRFAGEESLLKALSSCDLKFPATPAASGYVGVGRVGEMHRSASNFRNRSTE